MSSSNWKKCDGTIMENWRKTGRYGVRVQILNYHNRKSTQIPKIYKSGWTSIWLVLKNMKLIQKRGRQQQNTDVECGWEWDW